MALALPSLGAAVGATRAVARRFPLVLAAAVLCALSAILINDDIGPGWLRDRLLAAASLGIPLGVAARLLAERRGWPVAARAAAGAVVLLVLAAVWRAWPAWSDAERFVRYGQLSVAFHLLVAFVPFVGLDRPMAFWQYNRTLFERIVVAAASSATLFAGLALALAALDKLFGVDVPDAGYFRLWAVIAFVFNTGFFLGGVPDDLEALEQRADVPAALRVFAQYILLPLVSVYLVILTLYLGKVLVTRDWPSGWIGWLVSSVAAVGILTLLLVHPIAGRDDQKWVGLFARDFWRAILPPVVMLWLALYQRIHQYGFTEPRYFLLLLSLWLFAVAAWYAVSRSTRIRLIPASLCAVALASYAGPWSAYAVSERSQFGRLRAALERSGALQGGRLAAPRRPVAAADAREVSAVARYLVEQHGVGRLAPWIGDSLAARAAGGHGDGTVRMVVTALGFEYAAGGGGQGSFSYAVAARGALPVAGYEVMLRIGAGRDTIAVPGELRAQLDRSAARILVLRGADTVIAVPLDSMVVTLRRMRGLRYAGSVAPELLRAEARNGRAQVVVYLRRLGGQAHGARTEITDAAGEVLLRAPH